MVRLVQSSDPDPLSISDLNTLMSLEQAYQNTKLISAAIRKATNQTEHREILKTKRDGAKEVRALLLDSNMSETDTETIDKLCNNAKKFKDLYKQGASLTNIIDAELYDTVYVTSDIHGDYIALLKLLKDLQLIADDSPFPKWYTKQFDIYFKTTSSYFPINSEHNIYDPKFIGGVKWNPKKHKTLFVITGDIIDGRRGPGFNIAHDPYGLFELMILALLHNLRISAMKYHSDVLFTFGNHCWASLFTKYYYHNYVQLETIESYSSDIISNNFKDKYGDNVHEEYDKSPTVDNLNTIGQGLRRRAILLWLFYQSSPYIYISLQHTSNGNSKAILCMVHGGLHSLTDTDAASILTSPNNSYNLVNLLDAESNVFKTVKSLQSRPQSRPQSHPQKRNTKPNINLLDAHQQILLKYAKFKTIYSKLNPVNPVKSTKIANTNILSDVYTNNNRSGPGPFWTRNYAVNMDTKQHHDELCKTLSTEDKDIELKTLAERQHFTKSQFEWIVVGHCSTSGSENYKYLRKSSKFKGCTRGCALYACADKKFKTKIGFVDIAMSEAMGQHFYDIDYKDVFEVLRFTHTAKSNSRTGYYDIVTRVRNERTKSASLLDDISYDHTPTKVTAAISDISTIAPSHSMQNTSHKRSLSGGTIYAHKYPPKYNTNRTNKQASSYHSHSIINPSFGVGF